MRRVRVEFDEARALEVFQILDDCYQNKKRLYELIVLPQDTRPSLSDNPVELANFYFFVAHFMRGGVVNDAQFEFFWHLFNEFTAFFYPEKVYEDWPPSKIVEAIINVAAKINGNGKSKVGVLGLKLDEHLAHLHYNMGVLCHFWGSNVLKVFEGVENFEIAFGRVDYKNVNTGFHGMRRKIFALLTIWLQEANLLNRFPAPIPVDFHAMRILLQTGIVKSSDVKPLSRNLRHPLLVGRLGLRVKESFVDSIALWTQDFLASVGISHLVINPALWILGRELCAGHFQIRPVGGERDKYLDEAHLEMGPELWPSNYRNPCSFCPVETFCEAVVPSAPYYRWGLLIKLRRITYPDSKVLLPGLAKFVVPPLAKSRRKVIRDARK